MLFKYSRNILGRKIEIIDYLLTYFNNDDGDELLIMDPYFLIDEFVDDITQREAQLDILERIWASFFVYINKNILIKIISNKKSANQNRLLTRNSNVFEFEPKGNYSFRLSTLIFTGNNTRDPNDLHDRWILYKSLKNGNLGLHVGPSLDDFKNIDVTITEFIEEEVNTLIERFDYIWTTYQ